MRASRAFIQPGDSDTPTQGDTRICVFLCADQYSKRSTYSLHYILHHNSHCEGSEQVDRIQGEVWHMAWRVMTPHTYYVYISLETKCVHVKQTQDITIPSILIAAVTVFLIITNSLPMY